MGDGESSGDARRRTTVVLAVAMLAASVVGLAVSASPGAAAPVRPAGPTPVLAQVASGPSSSCIVSPDDMLGWWRGEGDVSGAVGPSLSGSVGFTDAVVGQGMVFDGSGGLTSSGLGVVSGAVSVDAWVRPVASGVVQSLFSRWTWVGGVADDSFLLMLAPSGELWWATDDLSTRVPEGVSAVVPQVFDGEFHHVAATWDPVETVVYLDGVAVASRASVAGSVNPAVSTVFSLGASSGIGSPMAFTGVIDDATVYDRALTGAEVAAIHDAGPAGKCAAWDQQVQISRSGGAAGDAFGSAVAVDGDTMVVGTYNEANQRGRARVYVRTGTNWSQQALLVASDAQLGDLFGSSVAVDRDTVVVGAPGTAPGDPGAAYVFTRTGSTWSQQAVLAPADGVDADEFGGSVAVSGDSVLIGSSANDVAGSNSGAAYVFARTGVTWAQQAKLIAPDGAADDRFGYSVGLDGTTAVVGAFGHDTLAGPDAGAAYAFQRTAGAWSPGSVLVAADGAESDLFGYSVAVSGSTALVGAFLDDDEGDASGSAYAFVRSGAGWGQQAKLHAGDASPADFFGWSVAIDGDRAIVGSMNDDSVALYAGSAYVVERTGATWLVPARIVGADTATEDSFGYSVAISATTAVVGAPGADRPAPGSGAAYVFVRR